MPPTKPILPVFEAIAASTPTRNEPSCSLNTTDWTLGRSTTLSMTVKWMLGNSRATLSRATACAKPTAMIGSCPLWAKRRSACSNWVSLLGSNSEMAMFVSFLKRSAPCQTPSLKDLSNLPPVLNTTAGLMATACACARAPRPTAASTEIRGPTQRFIAIPILLARVWTGPRPRSRRRLDGRERARDLLYYSAKAPWEDTWPSTISSSAIRRLPRLRTW